MTVVNALVENNRVYAFMLIFKLNTEKSQSGIESKCILPWTKIKRVITGREKLIFSFRANKQIILVPLRPRKRHLEFKRGLNKIVIVSRENPGVVHCIVKVLPTLQSVGQSQDLKNRVHINHPYVNNYSINLN